MKKPLGKVTHYYDKIEVAIVELAGGLKVGDTVKFVGKGREFEQPVESIQVEHVQVEKAKKGDVVGIKVAQPVKAGSVVTKV
jgi:putative protease